MWHNLKIVLVSFPLSVLVTATTIWVCHRRKWLVQPREDRWSRTPVAHFGGVGLLVVFLLIALNCQLTPTLRVVVMLTAGMGVVGFLDDALDLPTRWKFAAQYFLCTMAVAGGVVYPVFRNSTADIVFSVIWLMALTNAFNLLDNMDGLAAGVSIIVVLNLVLVMRTGHVAGLLTLLLALEGCLLGFLLFNFHPAKIFMGDTGSLAIGFFLGCAGVINASHISSMFSILFVPGLVFFLPLFDMVLVSVTRRFNGRAISAGAKDHTSHRLALLGMTERRTVLTLYLIAALSGIVAYVCKRFSSDLGPGVLAMFLLGATMFWFYVADIQLPENWLSRTNVFTLALPEVLNSISKRAAMVFTDAGLVVLSQFVAFVLRFDGIPHQYLHSLFWGAVLLVVVKIPLFALFSVYRRDWAIRSLRDIYPILKGSVLGSMVVVSALTYATGFRDYSRGVFGIEMVLTVLLLGCVRLAPKLFDDVLLANSGEGYLIVGGRSAEFFYRYFEWQRLHGKIAAFVTPGKNGAAFLFGIRVIHLAEMSGLLEKNHGVKGVYILPDCSNNDRDYVAQLCLSSSIPLHVFRFSLEKMTAKEPERDREVNFGPSLSAHRTNLL